MEHRASTRARHLTLFLAVPFVSFHVRFFLSSSAILVRLQVCWGLPLFRFQNTNTISLHLFYHLSTLTSLKQCPYVPLPDLHTRFWRQQFNRQFMRHSLLRTLLQPGVSALYPCFPTGCSGNSNFGFCNKFLFPGAGYQPAAQPPTWRTKIQNTRTKYYPNSSVQLEKVKQQQQRNFELCFQDKLSILLHFKSKIWGLNRGLKSRGKSHPVRGIRNPSNA